MGWPDFADLAHDELEQRAKDALRRGIEGSPKRRSCSGRATATRFSSSCRRWTRPARTAIEHVMSGVNPQGVPGGLVQEALRRGARPRLPLAHRACASRAGPHRHLQPVALRGGRRAQGASRVARGAAPSSGRARRAFWQERYEDINGFERHLDRNGTKIVKLFLHVSRAVQKQRFLARLDTPGKEWKFNAADVDERARWDDYMAAFEDALTATSTTWAPWYVIPADHKPVGPGARRAGASRDGQVARPPLARGLRGRTRREPRGAQEARSRDFRLTTGRIMFRLPVIYTNAPATAGRQLVGVEAVIDK